MYRIVELFVARGSVKLFNYDTGLWNTFLSCELLSYETGAYAMMIERYVVFGQFS